MGLTFNPVVEKSLTYGLVCLSMVVTLYWAGRPLGKVK